MKSQTDTKAISICMGEGEMTPKHRERIAAGIWMTPLGNLGTATHRYSSSVATEGPYTHAACWIGWTTSREETQIRGLA